jgi:SAM-dependent methyltransferase
MWGDGHTLPTMLAPRDIPPAYSAWNHRHGAPHGRRSRFARLLARSPLRGTDACLRAQGPFSRQTNNSTREYEYPWAYERVTERGPKQTVVDVGGSLGGLQFVLASEGHRVVTVDPGLEAHGLGWDVDAATFCRMCRVFGAPVELHPTTLGGAGLPDGAADVLLSVSTIEHFADPDLDEWSEHAARVVKPDGIVVLTIDLFLDCHPFAPRPSNAFGRNVDVCRLLEQSGLRLVEGDPSCLYGFPAFDPLAVMARLANYHIGRPYPAMAQCLVAKTGSGGLSGP